MGPKQSRPPEGIIAVKLFDRMIDRQTRELSRMLSASVAAGGGKVRLLLSIHTQLPARSPEALLENLQFARMHADHIDRMAIVGSRPWESTFVGLFSLFGGIETRYFDRSEAAEAVAWLQS